VQTDEPVRNYFLFMERQTSNASPLRKHAADALMRARRLPVGHARNDLRQLAIGLLWLDRNGLHATAKNRAAALLEMNGARE
jgi:hypothetical protein